MKSGLRYYLIIFLFSLFGCNGIETEHIIDNYYITAIDYATTERDVSYFLGDGNYVGVVSPTVFAIGFNENFIIVKQHPREFSNPPNKAVTNYFIIPIKNRVHISPDENKIGPLNKFEFEEKRKNLNIPETLIFSKIFED